MNGSTIKSIDSQIMNIGLKTEISSSKKTERVNSESFEAVMKKTTNDSAYEEKSTNLTEDTNVEEKVEQPKDIQTEDKAAETTNAKETDKDITDKSIEEGLESVLEEIIAELKNELANKLNVTEEELEEYMLTLGMDGTDLFDTKSLSSLVALVNGFEGSQDLLFDENAMKQFKEMLDIVNVAKAELAENGISVNETGFLVEATGEVMEADKNNTVSEKQEMPDEQILDEKISDKEAVQPEKQDESVAKDIVDEADIDMKEENLNNEKALTAESRNVRDVKQMTDNNQPDANNHSEEKSSNYQAVTNQTDNAAGLQNVGINPLEQIKEVLTESVGKAQSESILNQITEQIRINVNAEFKSMEMQLYPEHLGKVGVTIVAKEGILAAQITAESEAVKKVIETQLVTLKENFASQGLKVENVEVTVASHAFEQNDMSGNKEQSESNHGRRKNVLSSLDLVENAIEEEKLQEEMKELLGNTVSYTA